MPDGPAPERDTITAFFQELYGDISTGWLTLFSADRVNRRIHTDWIDLTNPGAFNKATDRAMHRAGTCCVWFGVATRRSKVPGRGGDADCATIPGLWLDIDIAGPGHANVAKLPATEAEAIDLLQRFELPPSLILHTGGGLQAWWLFATPHDFSPSDDLLDRWHATWKRIADQTGHHIDNVFDRARVMRVAGTINRKPGVPPAPVEIIEWIDGLRYHASDVAELLDDPLPPAAPQAPAPGPDNGDRPGDEFNASHTGNDVFAAAGWTLDRTDHAGNSYWIRPGKNIGGGHSAVVYADGHIANYSDASSLETHKAYDPWGLHVALNYDGDFSAAARAWRADHPQPRGDDWSFVGIPEPKATLPVPAAFDDSMLAETFGQVIAGRYLYCGDLGGWHRWDGRRWERDVTEAVWEECRRYILDLGRHLFASGAPADQLKACAAYRNVAAQARVVTATRRLRHIAATTDEFDQHPDLLNCRNGVVDLRTGQVRPHDPGLRITRLADTDYRPDATHPDVDAVLEVVEPPVRAWLQTLFGYSATGHVSEDVMPVLDGTGSNGKTTLLSAVSAALGEYGAPAPAKLLMRGGTDEHPTLIADLWGRRLVTIEETAEGGSLAVERMKALTGGSVLKARFMRKDYFSFEATHQLIVATNHRPAVNSTEHATWRRLRLVPFPHRYARPEDCRLGDRPVDRGLRARLKGGRAQREAMLAWIVAGAVAWHRDGLNECPEVIKATEEWRTSEDVIHRFVTERCDIATGASVRSSELHRAYRAWCEHEGRPAGSNKEFSKRLEDHDLCQSSGIRRDRSAIGVIWRGIGLQDDTW